MAAPWSAVGPVTSFLDYLRDLAEDADQAQRQM